MPLNTNSKQLIMQQLNKIYNNEPVRLISIGFLTNAQFEQLKEFKRSVGHTIPGSAELVYLGKHHYNSRVVKDNYSCLDLYLQIEAALSEDSIIKVETRMTAIQSIHPRSDGYGNTKIKDTVILELQSRHPRAEVFSAIPKGDLIKPQNKRDPLKSRSLKKWFSG